MSKKSSAVKTSGQVTLSLGDEKPLVVRRGGCNLTPLGGLPLVAKIERMFGLIEGASDKLDDRRTQSLIDHSKYALLKTRVMLIAAGMSDANDVGLVRGDGGLLKAIGEDPEEGQVGASQPTICRFENEVEEAELRRLYDWLVEYFIRCRRKPPRRIVLYVDGSAVQTHGHQEMAIWRGGKYGMDMYFPLFIFDHTGWLLVAELRAGDQGEVKRGATALIGVIKKLQAAWIGVGIGVRADAAFASPRLLAWLEGKGIDYVIGIAGNFAIAQGSYDYHCDAAKKFRRKFGVAQFTGAIGKRKKHGIHKKIQRMKKSQRKAALADWQRRRVRVYGEISYRSRTWKADRRVICRCDYSDSGLDCRYVVTNIVHACPQYIYEKEYCPHANVERCIKEFKNGLSLRLSCEQYTANAFRVILHALAYQLLYHLRQFLKAGQQHLSIESIRKTYINVAARVTCSERRVYWVLSDTYVYAKDFLHLCRRLARAG